MSQLHSIHSGSKTRKQTIQAGEAMATAGVPVIQAASGTGLTLGTTTAGLDQVGMTLDTAPTYNTAQQTDNSDPAVYVSVVTNADAVWQSRLSGAATSGSAVIPYFETVASTTGLIVTPAATSGGSAVDFQAITDSLIWCYQGANAGIIRRMLAVDATNVDVVVAFPFDTAVDDLFCFCPLTPFLPGWAATFTTTLDEINALVATAANTGSYYRPVDVFLNDVGNNGLLNSYVNLIGMDHATSGSSLA